MKAVSESTYVCNSVKSKTRSVWQLKDRNVCSLIEGITHRLCIEMIRLIQRCRCRCSHNFLIVKNIAQLEENLNLEEKYSVRTVLNISRVVYRPFPAPSRCE